MCGLSEGCPDGPGLSSTHRGRAMRRCREVFVGIDTAKTRNAAAIAEAGRRGEVRYLGEFDNTPDAVAKLVRKLGGPAGSPIDQHGALLAFAIHIHPA